MSQKQAAQMPRANSQAFGENFYATVLQDHFHRSDAKLAKLCWKSPAMLEFQANSLGRQRRQGRKPASAAAAALG